MALVRQWQLWLATVFIFQIWEQENVYCKVPKFLDTRIFAVIYLKFKQRGQTFSVFCQSDTNGIANSEDPDQTAPLGAV